MNAYSHLIAISAFIITIATSCTSTIKFSVKYPPEINLAEENKTVVIVNNLDPEALSLKKPKEVEVYNSGVRKLIIGLTDSISENDNIKFFACDSIVKIKADSSFLSPSFPEYINFVCREQSVNYLLILENFEIDFKDIDYDDDTELRDYTLIAGVSFDLHDRNGKLIDRSNLEESKLHKTTPVLIKSISIYPSIKNAGENVDLVSYAVGRKYRGKFYQSIENVNRQYYSGKIFKKVKPLIVKGDWENAKDALLIMTETNDPKISQEKVAYNLSVVYEALGDLESSKYWRSKSGNFNLNNFLPKQQY